MKEEIFKTWEDYEARVTEIFEAVRVARTDSKTYVSRPLFRGQADSSWKLSATLERFSSTSYRMHDYYARLQAVQPAVSVFGSNVPSLVRWNEREESLPLAPSGYEFMIYLRHHGFPSPLLDWTQSPYVAAFFAFRDARPSSCSVAVFSLREYVGDGKGGLWGAPTIVGCGPYVSAHPRHHIQQCEYTICKKKEEDRWVYCSHESATEGESEAQDVLVKSLIPASERDKVLEKLDRMNVNAYSLFGNEESLMETMAYREIEKREKGRL